MRLHPKSARMLTKIGTDIQTWRLAQGLTATSVADRAGITRATLRAIETDPTSVAFGNVLAVLAILGVDDAVAAAIDPSRSERGQVILTAAARREL